MYTNHMPALKRVPHVPLTTSHRIEQAPRNTDRDVISQGREDWYRERRYEAAARETGDGCMN